MRRVRRTTWSLCLLILALSASKIFAQYQFDLWNTDKGLPQNSVNAILQTRDGYLWLTTFDGLVRFDGVRFTVFNTSNSPGISSNRFLRLYEDGSGDLWAGTDDGGVVRYHEGHFTSYGKEQGLTSPIVIYQTEDAHGHLIVFLTDGPAMRLTEGKFLPVSAADPSLRPVTHRVSQSVPCYPAGDRVVCRPSLRL
jgi:ligand-binding sensor domain-containing protein